MNEKNSQAEKEYKVHGEDLLQTVKKLIAEGNIRRIIIKNKKGNSMLEVPLTIGAIGVFLAPVLAAVGALAALVTECTIVVVKKEVKSKK